VINPFRTSLETSKRFEKKTRLRYPPSATHVAAARTKDEGRKSLNRSSAKCRNRRSGRPDQRRERSSTARLAAPRQTGLYVVHAYGVESASVAANGHAPWIWAIGRRLRGRHWHEQTCRRAAFWCSIRSNQHPQTSAAAGMAQPAPIFFGWRVKHSTCGPAALAQTSLRGCSRY
jgi:hypothetical protein